MSDTTEPRDPAAVPPRGARPDTAPSPGGLELAGDFSQVERDYLAAQFSRCRIELLGRAPRNPAQAVIAWHVTGDTFNRRGPGPLLGTSMPRRAVYVLQADGSAGGRLVPIRSQQALLDEIGEAPEGVNVGPTSGAATSAWEGAKHALRGLMPWQPGR